MFYSVITITLTTINNHKPKIKFINYQKTAYLIYTAITQHNNAKITNSETLPFKIFPVKIMSLIFQRNSRLVEGNFQQANTPSPTTVLHNLWLPSFVIYGQTFGFPDSGLRLGCCKLKRIFHHTRLNLLLFLIYVYPRRWNRMRWRAFRKICGETWVAALSSGERRKKKHTPVPVRMLVLRTSDFWSEGQFFRFENFLGEKI